MGRTPRTKHWTILGLAVVAFLTLPTPQRRCVPSQRGGTFVTLMDAPKVSLTRRSSTATYEHTPARNPMYAYSVLDFAHTDTNRPAGFLAAVKAFPRKATERLVSLFRKVNHLLTRIRHTSELTPARLRSSVLNAEKDSARGERPPAPSHP